MNRSFVCLTLALSACSQSSSGVRITEVTPSPAVQAQARTEPVFYNGKTYAFTMAPDRAGSYALTISGMAASQQKDALALTTSAFHHFTCKDSQAAKLLRQPAFEAGAWRSLGACA